MRLLYEVEFAWGDSGSDRKVFVACDGDEAGDDAIKLARLALPGNDAATRTVNKLQYIGKVYAG